MWERLFENKVILVTGGASGLGRTLVRMFLDQKAKVAFTYLRSEVAAAEITKLSEGNAIAIRADASDYEAAQGVVSEVLSTFGRLDVLVNNAASAIHREFLALSSEDVRFSLENTFMPSFNYTHAATQALIESDSGSVVHIGSINGERGREGSMPYCAAKAAVEAMSKTVAKELGELGLRSNVVSPGYIATDGQRNTSPLIKKAVLGECAIRRLTQPEEVGNLVLFLASDLARNITGQVYRIDCGQYI